MSWHYHISSRNLPHLATMAKEDEEQSNVLEQFFVETLCWLVVISVNSAAVWKTYVILNLPDLGIWKVLCLQYNSITESSNDFISVIEDVFDERRLVNTWFLLLLSQRHPSTTFLNKQEISLFDCTHLGHENQGVLLQISGVFRLSW